VTHRTIIRTIIAYYVKLSPIKIDASAGWDWVLVDAGTFTAQIPIAELAARPTEGYVPRFRASALFGRRLPERVVKSSLPATLVGRAIRWARARAPTYSRQPARSIFSNALNFCRFACGLGPLAVTILPVPLAGRAAATACAAV
jgi:hypothetical protein